MYKLTDTFVLILLIFAVFLSVAYTTLHKMFAVFYVLFIYEEEAYLVVQGLSWHLVDLHVMSCSPQDTSIPRHR